jgi:single-strand DNA-binding protein
MNQLTIIGNMTADPEERTTPSGKRIASFKVATNDRKDNPVYFNCSAWERVAEPILKYFHKGSKIAVVGRVSAHAYKGKDGEPKAEIDVYVSTFEFCDRKPERGDAYDDDVKYDVKSGMAVAPDEGLPF